MPNLSVDYEESVEEYGKPYGGERLLDERLAAYRGRLPDSFVDFWQVVGLGKWQQGFFQFCDPQVYQSIPDKIFEGDADFKASRSFLIGFSAFGNLLVWNEDHRIVNIDTLHHRITCSKLFKPKPNVTADVTLGIAVNGVGAGANDPSDKDGKPLFQRVLKNCGELAFGQIYASKLHPALGGPMVVENFRPANALAALTIAAQAGPFTLHNSTVPSVPAVRTVGR